LFLSVIATDATLSKPLSLFFIFGRGGGQDSESPIKL
jgi:hypothetical protein